MPSLRGRDAPGYCPMSAKAPHEDERLHHESRDGKRRFPCRHSAARHDLRRHSPRRRTDYPLWGQSDCAFLAGADGGVRWRVSVRHVSGARGETRQASIGQGRIRTFPFGKPRAGNGVFFGHPFGQSMECLFVVMKSCREDRAICDDVSVHGDFSICMT